VRSLPDLNVRAYPPKVIRAATEARLVVASLPNPTRANPGPAEAATHLGQLPLAYGVPPLGIVVRMVGEAGLEPAISCSQSTCVADYATPRRFTLRNHTCFLKRTSRRGLRRSTHMRIACWTTHFAFGDEMATMPTSREHHTAPSDLDTLLASCSSRPGSSSNLSHPRLRTGCAPA
jgi:hypothetical protein